MRKFTLNIPNNMGGRDIKFILKNHFHLSDRMITGLKKGNGIMLNGKKEYVIKIVHTDDFLEINLPENSSENILPIYMPLDILYEDEDIIAVNKPRDMPTHPSLHHYDDTLANAVMYYFRDRPFTFRAISRLDRYTSGIVVIAKNAPCANQLCLAMRRSEFKKEYYAICRGIPSPEKGRITAPILREKAGIIKRCISDNGKNSITDYCVCEKTSDLSLIRLVPITGRTHQLRLHMSHIGCPIYGDFMYGPDVSGSELRLHCRKVCFIHPFSGNKIEIEAPMPDDMNLSSITL